MAEPQAMSMHSVNHTSILLETTIFKEVCQFLTFVILRDLYENVTFVTETPVILSEGVCGLL